MPNLRPRPQREEKKEEYDFTALELNASPFFNYWPWLSDVAYLKTDDVIELFDDGDGQNVIKALVAYADRVRDTQVMSNLVGKKSLRKTVKQMFHPAQSLKDPNLPFRNAGGKLECHAINPYITVITAYRVLDWLRLEQGSEDQDASVPQSADLQRRHDEWPFLDRVWKLNDLEKWRERTVKDLENLQDLTKNDIPPGSDITIQLAHSVYRGRAKARAESIIENLECAALHLRLMGIVDFEAVTDDEWETIYGSELWNKCEGDPKIKKSITGLSGPLHGAVLIDPVFVLNTRHLQSSSPCIEEYLSAGKGLGSERPPGLLKFNLRLWGIVHSISKGKRTGIGSIPALLKILQRDSTVRTTRKHAGFYKSKSGKFERMSKDNCGPRLDVDYPTETPEEQQFREEEEEELRQEAQLAIEEKTRQAKERRREREREKRERKKRGKGRDTPEEPTGTPRTEPGPTQGAVPKTPQKVKDPGSSSYPTPTKTPRKPDSRKNPVHKLAQNIIACAASHSFGRELRVQSHLKKFTSVHVVVHDAYGTKATITPSFANKQVDEMWRAISARVAAQDAELAYTFSDLAVEDHILWDARNVHDKMDLFSAKGLVVKNVAFDALDFPAAVKCIGRDETPCTYEDQTWNNDLGHVYVGSLSHLRQNSLHPNRSNKKLLWLNSLPADTDETLLMPFSATTHIWHSTNDDMFVVRKPFPMGSFIRWYAGSANVLQKWVIPSYGLATQITVVAGELCVFVASADPNPSDSVVKIHDVHSFEWDVPPQPMRIKAIRLRPDTRIFLPPGAMIAPYVLQDCVWKTSHFYGWSFMRQTLRSSFESLFSTSAPSQDPHPWREAVIRMMIHFHRGVIVDGQRSSDDSSLPRLESEYEWTHLGTFFSLVTVLNVISVETYLDPSGELSTELENMLPIYDRSALTYARSLAIHTATVLVGKHDSDRSFRDDVYLPILAQVLHQSRTQFEQCCATNTKHWLWSLPDAQKHFIEQLELLAASIDGLAPLIEHLDGLDGDDDMPTVQVAQDGYTVNDMLHSEYTQEDIILGLMIPDRKYFELPPDDDVDMEEGIHEDDVDMDDST